MSVKTCVLVFIFLASAIYGCYAQNSPPDSLIYSSAASNAINYFNTALGSQTEIYNGASYEMYPSGKSGTHYLEDKIALSPALIRYSGTWYKNVPGIYDVFNDEMVAALGESLFVLPPGKVSDILLLNHHFIYMDINNRDGITTGYYDLLYNGKLQVLVKRSKTYEENVVLNRNIEAVYTDKINIYIKKGGAYFEVDGKTAVLELLKDKKNELNQYLKTQKLRYKDDREGFVVALTKYYDQINK